MQPQHISCIRLPILAVPRKPKRPHPFNHGCLVICAFVIMITSPSSSPSSLLSSSSTCGLSCSNGSSSPLVQPRVALISSPLALLVMIWGCGTLTNMWQNETSAMWDVPSGRGDYAALPPPPHIFEFLCMRFLLRAKRFCHLRMKKKLCVQAKLKAGGFIR